jgi:hypothetical protein
MGSSDSFPANISKLLLVSFSQDAYQPKNTLNPSQQMLKHND